MTILERTVAPPHPIVFIVDPSQRHDVPGAGYLDAFLGPLIDNPEGELAFDGEILTPGQTVAVVGSDAEYILSMPVSGRTARVKVWVNCRREPDLVIIQAQ